MKKILIIGATSSIAKHCARLWATHKSIFFLVARDQSHLKIIKNDLIIRGAANVFTYKMDVNHFTSHSKMLKKAQQTLKDIDTVLIAHGSLPNQKACELHIKIGLQEISTNAISSIALLSEIANYFEQKKKGTIAIISSVAGDRGRASNYFYGSAKAMISTFASGLRQRLHRSNVAVVTIKPGLIDTPMTSEFNKGFLWSTPEKIAKKIINAIDQKKSEVYVPSYWQYIMFLIKNIPHFIFNRMKF